MKRPPAVPLLVVLLATHGLLFALPVVLVLVTGALWKDQVRARQDELYQEATLAAMVLDAELAAGRSLEDLDVGPALERIRNATRSEVRVLDPSGRVRFASSHLGVGEDIADRPEVAQALLGFTTVSARPVPPFPLPADGPQPATWTYAATPLTVGEERVGVLTLTRPTRGTLEALGDLVEDLGWPAAAVALAGLGLAGWLGWRVSRSLRRLAAIADRLAEGAAVAPQELEGATLTRASEVRRLARAFATMTGRLQERLRYNQEFAANVSHEFKTPITTLRGTLDLLADDPALPPEQRARFLENARTDLDRLSRLVGGLLQLARAEAGATARDELDLDGVLDTVRRRHPEVRFIAGAGLVQGDGAQLELVVDNLLANARQHGAPPVTLTGWSEAGRTGFDVVDAGPGISPSNLPHVFDRFFTTGRGRTGTGLGLALVKAVVDAHGGVVGVQSRPGRTRFRVDLPALDDQDAIVKR